MIDWIALAGSAGGLAGAYFTWRSLKKKDDPVLRVEITPDSDLSELKQKLHVENAPPAKPSPTDEHFSDAEPFSEQYIVDLAISLKNSSSEEDEIILEQKGDWDNV